MGQENFDEERWLISEIATQSRNDEEEEEYEEEDEEEEALSLSDLPLIHQWRKENRNDDNNNNDDFSTKEEGEEFDFCSHSKESEMCAADELFFKGQILPLRHSVSSEKGLLQNYDGGGYRRRSISRSDSMDHYYSSRSSSMSSSHQSSSSGSSSATTAAASHNPRLPPRIHFHTHPSPSPRLHFPSSRHGGAAITNNRNSIKKSSIWNVLRLGLVTPPPPSEITFQDLKARSGNSSNRNSTSSNSSGGASKKKKMMLPRILGGGGCKCAADAVAPRVVIIKRSASEGDAAVGQHDRSAAEKLMSKAAAKKHLSQHRTFEWLKQLSVEATAAAAAADQS